MPLIQLNLPDKLDKRVRQFMLRHDIVRKSDAIIMMLEGKQ